MLKKKKNHYVDNQKFYECIVEYKKSCEIAEAEGRDKPRIPEYAGGCILLIAENVAERYYKFARYSYNDEMKNDAILNCIKYFDSFDETRYTNPHAYFTMVCYRSNQMRIKIEQENQYVKFKHFDREVFQHSFGDDLIDKEMYDNINLYIDNFEKREEDRKKKRKEKMNEKKMRDSLDRFMEEDDAVLQTSDDGNVHTTDNQQ